MFDEARQRLGVCWADGHWQIAQASRLSKHGDTSACSGNSSGKNIFSSVLHIVPKMSSTRRKKTTRITGLTKFPWSAHRVSEYNQVVPPARFLLWARAQVLISFVYLDIRTIVGLLAYRRLSTKLSCHLSPSPRILSIVSISSAPSDMSQLEPSTRSSRMWKALAGCTKSWILSHQGEVDATLGGGGYSLSCIPVVIWQ